MVQHPRHLSALSTEEVTALASLLSLPRRLLDWKTGTPTDLWLAAQTRRAADLPRTLRRPQDWLARLSMAAKRHLPALEDLVPQCAVLCAGAHRGLNPWLVRRAFFLISHEVTVGPAPLRRYLAHPGRHNRAEPKLAAAAAETAAEVRALVDRLAATVALWMDAAAVGRLVDDAGVVRFPRIGSECEACIVAAVGADAQTLCDLRAALLGRAHTRTRKRKAPVLLRLVEAWIARFEGPLRDDVLRESERMGRVVKRVRRAVHHCKRGDGKKSGHGHGHRSRHGGSSGSSSRSGGSHGKQTSASLSSSHGSSNNNNTTTARPSTTSSPATITPSRRHHRDRQSDNTISGPAVVDDNKPRLQQTPSHRFSHSNTVDDIIDAYGGGFEDDDEIDETDPLAADRFQDVSCRWYGAFSDVGEQHPAFRQSVADIEAAWLAGSMTRSQVAAPSALVAPLRLSGEWDGKGSGDDGYFGAPRAPFEDDDEGIFDPAQWTDVSVPATTTTNSTTRKLGRGRLRSPAPSVPRVPSLYRAALVRSIVVDESGAAIDDAASLYSQDGTALPHPPTSTTYLPDEPRAAEASRPGVFMYMDPRASPPLPRKGITSAVASDITVWPGPEEGQLTTPSRSSSRRHHRHETPQPSSSSSSSSSSHRSHRSGKTTTSTLSAHDFQRGLEQLSLDDPANPPLPAGRKTVFGGRIPEGTVLPSESVSVVGGLYPPPRPGEADEAFARALQSGELERSRPGPAEAHVLESDSDSDEEEEEEEDVDGDRGQAALSRGARVREDEERRKRAGRKGMFSDIVLPGEW